MNKAKPRGRPFKPKEHRERPEKVSGLISTTAYALLIAMKPPTLSMGERLDIALKDWQECRRLLDGNSGHTRPFERGEE